MKRFSDYFFLSSFLFRVSELVHTHIEDDSKALQPLVCSYYSHRLNSTTTSDSDRMFASLLNLYPHGFGFIESSTHIPRKIGQVAIVGRREDAHS